MIKWAMENKFTQFCVTLFAVIIAVISMVFLILSYVRIFNYGELGECYVDARYVTGTIKSFANSGRYRMMEDDRKNVYIFPSGLISIHAKDGDSVSLVLTAEGNPITTEKYMLGGKVYKDNALIETSGNLRKMSDAEYRGYVAEMENAQSQRMISLVLMIAPGITASILAIFLLTAYKESPEYKRKPKVKKIKEKHSAGVNIT